VNARNSGSYFTFSSRTLIVMVSGRVMTLITSSTASGYRRGYLRIIPEKSRREGVYNGERKRFGK